MEKERERGTEEQALFEALLFQGCPPAQASLIAEEQAAPPARAQREPVLSHERRAA